MNTGIENNMKNKAMLKQAMMAGILGMGVFWGTVASASSEAMQRLNQFFTTVTTMQSSFSQEVRDENGRVRQKSTGTVALYRPGRFRWEYTSPDRHVIVANGSKVWIYDEELDQVTIKPMQQTLASSPVGLLLNKQPVQKQFQVTEIMSDGRLDWFHMIPHKKDSDFVSMDLGIDQNSIQEMILKDKFGQETRIRLSNTQLGAQIDPSQFKFVPPPGVDVIGG